MKNERILLADDMEITMESLSEMIEIFGEKDGHAVIGKAQSIDEVKTLLEGGLRPTVALVDHRFPHEGDGQKAAEIIRKLSPKTLIISYSSTLGLKWGDRNWNKVFMDTQQLINALTNLQH